MLAFWVQQVLVLTILNLSLSLIVAALYPAAKFARRVKRSARTNANMPSVQRNVANHVYLAW